MLRFVSEWQVKAGDSPGVNTVEVRFKESEGDQGRKRAVLVRTKGEGRRGGEEVELLQELYQINVGRAELPLTAFYSTRRWQVWTRSQEIQCMRQGLSVEARNGEKEEKRPRARLIPEEFAVHSGRIGGATRLAAMGASPLVIQREGRWS